MPTSCLGATLLVCRHISEIQLCMGALPQFWQRASLARFLRRGARIRPAALSQAGAVRERTTP